MDFKAYLKTMVEQDASDLYLSSGAAPSAKINGALTPLEDDRLTSDQVKAIAYSIMNAEQIGNFEVKPEMNLAISENGIGRFRVNIFRQRNSISGSTSTFVGPADPSLIHTAPVSFTVHVRRPAGIARPSSMASPVARAAMK